MRKYKKIIGTLKYPFQVRKKNEEVVRLLNELNWANIFNNTIQGSSWFVNESVSPGRSAIGYPVFYLLYRILNDTNPRSILEFGLGQSSNLFSRYAAKDAGSSVITVEHDQAWIDFYASSRPTPSNMRLEMLELKNINYKGRETLSMKDVTVLAGQQKFDLIFVDGPFGSPHYSRSQVLELLPANISPDNFCIVLDDYDRDGEKETGNEVERILRENNIPFHKGVYRGMKDVVLYCSQNKKFLVSL